MRRPKPVVLKPASRRRVQAGRKRPVCVDAPPRLGLELANRGGRRLFCHLPRTGRGSLCLKTLTAEDRAALSRFKRYCRFDAAGGTAGPGFGSRDSGSCRPHTHARTDARPARLTRFTTFWVVFEQLVEEKQLLPSGENELPTAITAG